MIRTTPTTFASQRLAQHVAWRPAPAAALVAFAALALCLALAQPAWAVKTLTAPTDVSDDITRIHVTKLDAQTHEQLKGATLQISEKDSGTVVDEWETDGTTHETDKTLNVNTTYILSELEAPEGYDAIDDIEFVVNETEGEGVSITSGESDQWELTDSYKLAVYDAMTPVEEEEVVHKTTTSTTGGGTSTSSTASSGEDDSNATQKSGVKTGDTTNVLPVVAVAVAAILLLAFALYRRRSQQDDSHGTHARK